IAVIEGKRRTIEHELEKDMVRAAKTQDFEQAAKLRNQLYSLQSLNKQVIFSDKEFMDISKDHALVELVDLLTLGKFPVRIEGYDISHMQGTDVVASMVVFTNGVSNKEEYRKFKTKKDHNNDFYNMNETIKRRLSDKNRKAWGLPSLILIDGGKGQLDAAIHARNELGCPQLPFIGLAKREEQIVIQKGKSNVELNMAALHKLGGYATESEDFILVNVPHSTNVIKLLQRIRDESHRFAVSYHSVLKGKRQMTSILDDIAGVGPATRKKLMRKFGSLRGIKEAPETDLAAVVGVGLAHVLFSQLH
ncbi:MAG TPA: UvrB/UvrC motif-containing protein, partial [Candidatus Saccharimonadales bacterium]|nr:UvrB/UvrC motif-containing protein [Candidatus Saccharimonadales bacterium]